MARPPADQLTHRCTATAAHTGRQCGSPAADGYPLCTAHLPKQDAKKIKTTRDRIIALGDKALTRAEKILEHGSDSDAAKVITQVLARIAPVAGPNVLIVNQNSYDPGAPVSSAAELIRARMAHLATGQFETSTVPTSFDDDVVDAEIVEPEPTPPAVDVQEPTPVASQGGLRVTATKPPVADVTVVREKAYGVPRVTSRPSDLDRLAERRRWA